MFDDVSSYTTKIDNAFSINPKGLAVISGKAQYVKGTGRFEGIKGTEVLTGRQVSSAKDFASYAEIEGTATYTLPSK